MTEAPILVALGSNIEPAVYLLRAVEELAARLRVVAASTVYASAAVGAAGTPDFYNAAVEVATELEPKALKWEVLRPVEAALGRRRTGDRNAPRTIDLDLALYGERSVPEGPDGIALPDPDIVRYLHLARPLADLHPTLVHPADGRTLEAIVEGLERGGQKLRRSEVSLVLGPSDPA